MSKKLAIKKTPPPIKPTKAIPEGTYKIAEQLYKTGQIESAKQLCRMILETNSNHILALHLLGMILANNRQLLEAAQLVAQAAKLHPHSYKINSTLAYIYRLLNKIELADLHAKKAAQGRFYIDWIKQFDTLTAETINAMRAKLAQWSSLAPTISIIMTTYNSNLEWLKVTIDSIINQIYPHWELCIIDNGSNLSYIHPILEDYAKQNIRIKIHFNSTNENLSLASNHALTLVTGNYVALLNQDDVLPNHALYFIANEIIAYPNAALIYSDEDIIDEFNERMFPHFKCDWNPDLFLSYNFISHLSIYKTELIRKLNGFRIAYENAKDYDLTLRLIEHIELNNIRHIPHILYHQRLQKNSANLNFVITKPSVCATVQKIITEHLQRCNKTAQVTESYALPGTFRVQYALPPTLPLVSIIIPTRNQHNLLRVCVGSILAKTNYTNFEIVIIDNQSDDIDTLEYLASLQNNSCIKILSYPHQFNYSAINNFAITYAQGELICLLNNDTEVINESWLTEMVSHAVRPEIGAVGAKLWYSNNALQHGGVIIGLGGVADHSHKHQPRGNAGYFGRTQLIQNLSAVTSACMVMRKDVFNKVGGLNSTDLTIAFNDIDMCLKIISLELRIVWTPFAELYHHESVSRGREDTPEKKTRFNAEIAYMKKTWKHLLSNDSAYNPNLTVNNNNFAIAWPPRVNINETAIK